MTAKKANEDSGVTRMNAQQIKEALKPMAVFAPALMAATEIVESAEAAEAKLAATKKEQARLEKVIADLEVMRQEHEAKMQQAKQALNQANNDVADRKAAIEAELKAVRDQVDKARDELDELDTKYAEKKTGLERELASLNEQIESGKKRHAAFLKSIGA